MTQISHKGKFDIILNVETNLRVLIKVGKKER